MNTIVVTKVLGPLSLAFSFHISLKDGTAAFQNFLDLLQESFQESASARGLDHITSLLFLTAYGDIVVFWVDVFHYAKGQDTSKIQPRYHVAKLSIGASLFGLFIISELFPAQRYSLVCFQTFLHCYRLP
jgi:hypothetical protein